MSGQEQASVNIPKDLLEPIIRQHIAAGVVAAIGDPARLIQGVVERAVKTKVDNEGKVSDSSYCNSHDLIEVVCRNTIIRATKAAIENFIAKQEPLIVAAVEKELRKSTSKFAKALVDGFVTSAKQRWNVDCKFEFVDRDR